MHSRYAAAAVGAFLLGWGLATTGTRNGAPPLDMPADVEGPVALLWGRALDLNRASAADLEVLPGVGPSRAAAIVRERCQRPFGAVADLLRVPGIGERTVERLAGWARVDDPVPQGCAGGDPAAQGAGPAAGDSTGFAAGKEGA